MPFEWQQALPCAAAQTTGTPPAWCTASEDYAASVDAALNEAKGLLLTFKALLRRLYRAEASRHTLGNGLGLSMVAAVARLHDLQLTVSDAGPGCRVELVGKG